MLSASLSEADDEVFTPAEVATRWKCSASFVRRMIDNGELPAFRVGGKLLRVTARAVREYEACRNTSSRSSAGLRHLPLRRGQAGQPPAT